MSIHLLSFIKLLFSRNNNSNLKTLKIIKKVKNKINN